MIEEQMLFIPLLTLGALQQHIKIQRKKSSLHVLPPALLLPHHIFMLNSCFPPRHIVGRRRNQMSEQLSSPHPHLPQTIHLCLDQRIEGEQHGPVSFYATKRERKIV